MSDGNIHRNFWGGWPEAPWKREKPMKLIDMFNAIWREVGEYSGSDDLVEEFRDMLVDADVEIEALAESLDETTDLLADCEASREDLGDYDLDDA